MGAILEAFDFFIQQKGQTLATCCLGCFLRRLHLTVQPLSFSIACLMLIEYVGTQAQQKILNEWMSKWMNETKSIWKMSLPWIWANSLQHTHLKDICLRNKQEGGPYFFKALNLGRGQLPALGTPAFLISVLTQLRTMEKQYLPVASLSGDLWNQVE